MNKQAIAKLQNIDNFDILCSPIVFICAVMEKNKRPLFFYFF